MGKLLAIGIVTTAVVTAACDMGIKRVATPPATVTVTSVSISASPMPNGHIDDQDRVFLSTISRDSYSANRNSVMPIAAINGQQIYYTDTGWRPRSTPAMSVPNS